MSANRARKLDFVWKNTFATSPGAGSKRFLRILVQKGIPTHLDTEQLLLFDPLVEAGEENGGIN